MTFQTLKRKVSGSKLHKIIPKFIRKGICNLVLRCSNKTGSKPSVQWLKCTEPVRLSLRKHQKKNVTSTFSNSINLFVSCLPFFHKKEELTLSEHRADTTTYHKKQHWRWRGNTSVHWKALFFPLPGSRGDLNIFFGHHCFKGIVEDNRLLPTWENTLLFAEVVGLRHNRKNLCDVFMFVV